MKQHQSLYPLFQEIVAGNADRIAYQYKKDGRWIDVTWAEQSRMVSGISRSLIQLGVRHGERVAVLSKIRVEWIQADFGIACCGGVTVGIYHSNLGPECAYILNHADAELLFVENAEQLEKIVSVRTDLPLLKRIVLFEGPSDPDAGILSWEDFLKLGKPVSDEQVRERAEAIQPDDLISLVYTSGTTGVPKGVMLTHRNVLFATWSCYQCLDIHGHHTTLHFLPLAHVYSRLTVYFCMRCPITMAIVEDLPKLGDNLKEVRPHFIVSVPRIYEKIYQNILTAVAQAGGHKKKIFEWALEVGRRVSRLRLANQPIPFFLGLEYRLAEFLALRKVQAAFGGRLVWAVSGAAPLDTTVAEFFHACGIQITEGIGMTENASFSHCNRRLNNKIGTVGQPGPGIDVKLGEDGEVLFRGPNVMKGYFKNPEATAETIDSDGWLHSGDIGEIDAEGFLKITDRKKDLIITSGGKNVAPARVENVLRTSTYISQVVAYGDRRKYLTALITLDPGNILKWATNHGIETRDMNELTTDSRVRSLIMGEIDQRNRQLASFETVKKFHILPHDLTIEGGELTPTLKLKRKVIVDKYKAHFEALYED